MNGVKTAPVDLLHVRAASQRIHGWVHRTPVFTCQALDDMAGRELYFKAENLQKTGAFKARGACNAVRSVSSWIFFSQFQLAYHANPFQASPSHIYYDLFRSRFNVSHL